MFVSFIKRLAKIYSIVLFNCFLLLAFGFVPENFAFQTLSPLKFEIKTIDPATKKRKTIYSVGETVSVVFTLTNQGRTAVKIKELQDTEIPVKIAWTPTRTDKTEVREGVRGGTGGSYTDVKGNIFWTDRPPRYTTILPGQKIEVDIEDLGRFNARHLDDGEYKLMAEYENGQTVQCGFRVLIDEAKSVPILERMLDNTIDDSAKWATVYLKIIRQPSIRGLLAEANGQPVRDVWINITSSGKTNIETGFNGFYDLISLIPGGIYTLTSSLEGYTFMPSSRTITNLNSKLKNITFTAKLNPKGS